MENFVAHNLTNFEQAAVAGVPSAHLNGTSRRDLEQNYRDAHEAINSAIDVIAKTAPHPRDYYVQGPQTGYELARAKHEARLKALHELLDGIVTDYQVFDALNPVRR